MTKPTDTELLQRLTNIIYRHSMRPAKECLDLASHLAGKGILNTAQMADLYGTQQEVIRQWARAKRIPGATKIGRDWLFDVNVLPERLRVTNSGRGGLPARLQKAVMEAPEGLSIKETAERFGVSSDTVRALREQRTPA